jgi:peptide/nickel transport system ATP-binding protein/oligopeptide transport system ATP-binding protein
MGTAVNTILEIKGLKIYFPVKAGFMSKKGKYVKAVDGVSFALERGRTLGLAGESGCGKTTIGKGLLSIHKPTAGKIFFDGKEISGMSQGELSQIRRDIGLIFQDPLGSLDPRQSMYSAIKEAVVLDKIHLSGQEVKNRVSELMSYVDLNESLADRFPHEMSRGQRQRLCIARALACNPKLIVCDESVSALDVSIQAQIINLLRKLQKQMGLTYVFIAHDLSVVRHIADIVAVMYLGRIVEMMDSDELYGKPMHPYTKALLSAVPTTDYYSEKSRERIVLQGEVPSPINVPSGCTFHPRCPYVTEECRNEAPVLKDSGTGHKVACHNVATSIHYQVR